jgi:hypothetical protein
VDRSRWCRPAAQSCARSSGHKDELHILLQAGLVTRVAAEAFDLDPARLTVPPLDALDLPHSVRMEHSRSPHTISESMPDSFMPRLSARHCGHGMRAALMPAMPCSPRIVQRKRRPTLQRGMYTDRAAAEGGDRS